MKLKQLAVLAGLAGALTLAMCSRRAETPAPAGVWSEAHHFRGLCERIDSLKKRRLAVRASGVPNWRNQMSAINGEIYQLVRQYNEQAKGHEPVHFRDSKLPPAVSTRGDALCVVTVTPWR